MTEAMVAGDTIVGKYVENLEFKRKKVGGIDEMDALGKIEELAGLYEERMNELVREAAQAKREADMAAKRAEKASAAEAELARVQAELANEKARADGLAAKLAAREGVASVSAPAFPSNDDFMRTLQEVRSDVLSKARDEASSIVARARENAESVASAERERRNRAVVAARTARDQAESAMRKLADALGDVEALESGLATTDSSADFSAQAILSRLRLSDVPSPLDPWDPAEGRR